MIIKIKIKVNENDLNMVENQFSDDFQFQETQKEIVKENNKYKEHNNNNNNKNNLTMNIV
jgi:hypothetical protein